MTNNGRRHYIFGTSLGFVVLVVIVVFFGLRGCVRVQQSASGCFRCHPEVRQKLTSDKKHPVFEQRACLACHNSHSGGDKQAGLKQGGERDLCSSCHPKQREEAKNKEAHPPYEAVYKEDGKCSTCHDPHGSNFHAILKNSQKRQCTMCHPPIAKFFNFASDDLHPPFRWVFEVGANCTQCHNPHGSGNDFILKFKAQVLCRTCHPTIAGFFQSIEQHKPFTEGKCTRCHNPHGSVYTKFLKEPQPFICFRCHNVNRVDGAPNIQDFFLKEASHHPVLEPGKATGRQIVCTECHADIHGSKYPRLLGARETQVCYRCHPEKGEFFEDIGHGKDARIPGPPPTAIKCLNCHQSIHGSDFERLFLKLPEFRCLDCHEKKNSANDTLPKIGELGHRHPMAIDRAGLKDPKRGNRMSCFSTCHNPHGTGNEKLLRVPGTPDRPFRLDFQLDRFCLQCHRNAGIGNVGIDF
ncbi:MAG: cytochrome c3 family protein [Terriglobia bacterium]